MALLLGLIQSNLNSTWYKRLGILPIKGMFAVHNMFGDDRLFVNV